MQQAEAAAAGTVVRAGEVALSSKDEETGLLFEAAESASHVTGSMKVLVPKAKEPEFRAWLESMMPINYRQPGFVEREILHLTSSASSSSSSLETYVVVLRYADYDGFSGWLLSEDRKEALRRLDGIIGEKHVTAGMRRNEADIISSDAHAMMISPVPPPPPKKVRPPPKWKLWLLLSNLVFLDLLAEYPLGIVSSVPRQPSSSSACLLACLLAS